MKKVITLLLALVMMLSMLTACSGDPATPPEESKKPSGSSSQQQPGEEVNVYEAIGLPEDINYSDAVINIMHWDEANAEFDISIEDQNGDPIIDAIYKRNLYTEQLLGVEFNFIHNEYKGNTVAQMNEWCDKLQNAMNDPTTPIDIFASYSRVLSTATVRGLNQDISAYNNIDLSKGWWPKAIIDELSIDGKLFIFTGDISTNVLHNMYVMFYNKTIAEQRGIEDLVAVVENNEWTIDKMIEVTKDVWEDAGTDGKTIDDQLGLTMSYWCADALIQGANFKILEAGDADSGEYIKLTDDFFSEVFDQFISKLGDWSATNDIYNDAKYIANIGTPFLEDRALFNIAAVSYGFSLQETDVDYAILPTPLRDTAQQGGYRTTIANTYSNYGMARSCKDGERAAAVVSALGYYAHELTTPAIFEVTFKGKFSKEAAMVDMFDRIREGICFDMGLLYMRELNSINDMPTMAIQKNEEWLGKKMDSFQRRSIGILVGKLNNKLDTAVNAG